MELIFAIADKLDIPNEFVFIDRIIEDIVWLHTKSGACYTCKTVRGGKYMKANSLRPD